MYCARIQLLLSILILGTVVSDCVVFIGIYTYIVSEDDAAVYELMVSNGIWWFLGRSGDRKVFDVALTSTISR